jgi:hypothetical protein
MPVAGPAALGEGDPGPAQDGEGGGVAAALGRPVTTEPSMCAQARSRSPPARAAAQLPGRRTSSATWAGSLSRCSRSSAARRGRGRARSSRWPLVAYLAIVAATCSADSSRPRRHQVVMLRTRAAHPPGIRAEPPSTAGQGTRTAGTACGASPQASRL